MKAEDTVSINVDVDETTIEMIQGGGLVTAEFFSRTTTTPQGNYPAPRGSVVVLDDTNASMWFKISGIGIDSKHGWQQLSLV